ncbi:M23 family metallopeptidase [Streptomyces sp. Da 82-17]|uniref:M23 family metallopeptidase n=1 Tax=Streptomyces sp. Da 82-17 TaxID=3377116 RepID=UPI0038D4A2FE
MAHEVSDHSSTAERPAPATPGADSAATDTTRRRALGLAAGLLGAGALGFRLPVPESALRAPADPNDPDTWTDLTGACSAYYDREYEQLLAAVDEAQFQLSDADLRDPGLAGACAEPAPQDRQGDWVPERGTDWGSETPTGPWSWTGGGEGRWTDDRSACPAGPAAGAEGAAAARPWARPLTRRYRITTGYRVRGNWLAGYHTGVDLAVPQGTPVWSVAQGVVVLARWSGAYGKAVTVRMRDGRYVLYAHLSRINVRAGARVFAGQRIGSSGNTGRSTGPHLHLEIRARRGYGSDINPISYLAKRGIRI